MIGRSSTAGALALRDVRTLFDAGTATGLSDRQLLDRFGGERDDSSDAAFETLVLRHGPMVLRVCRNLLRDPSDADDAFQATFLVLVRRRTSVRQLESLGGWLHGVACRVAARARVESARRRSVEERAALRVVEAVDPAAEAETEDAELGPIVQEEVRLLPEKYRAVVVLCYWQGLTQELAAAQLRCPLGTVRSRLARARKLLERRLTGRGLAPLGSAFAAPFDSTSPARAASIARGLAPLTPALVRSTIEAACRVINGSLNVQGVSAFSAYLVQRVLWSMSMFKIGNIVATVAIVGIVGVGAGIAAQRAGQSTAVGLRSGAQQERDVERDLPDPPRAVNKDASGPRAQDSEPAGPEQFYCEFHGQTTILSILPDGAKVKKGHIVCELDAARVRDDLAGIRRASLVAAANYETARTSRELAELTVAEYIEGLYIQELQEAEIRIKTAEAELAVAEDDLEGTRQLFDKKQVGPRTRAISELKLKKARFALEAAQSRRKVLVEYTRPKRIKELKLAVVKERSEEVARKNAWEEKTSAERELEQQIAAHTIKAPFDGTMVYAKPDSHRQSGRFQQGVRLGDPSRPVEKGAVVLDQELLFEVVPASEIEK